MRDILLRLRAEPGELTDAAAAEIHARHPDAVTFNEACGGDVARIARRTGYHVRFSSIVYFGKRLPCVRPRGRGLFLVDRRADEWGVSPAAGGPERTVWFRVATRSHQGMRS